MKPNFEQYQKALKDAVSFFWSTRERQINKQKNGVVQDHGTRGAVTGGKQMDGFVQMFKKISMDAGVPEKCIYLRGNELPGFFRPTKDWDFIIISPKGHLISCIEFKSQVGSFGNNFNNRTEEALGSAVDLWTAFKEGVFPRQLAPWLGYFIMVERSPKSTSPVRVREPFFKAMPEFQGTSYLDRYKILCSKLILERHYTAASLIWTSYSKGKVEYGFMEQEVAFDAFVESYIGYLNGRIKEFGG